ncbi:ATP-dependent endonuclease [Pseudomonas sp. Irchel 3A7]|uniref:ATP-dependent nuclease n=1 Tax=Pseudomonas sp. Irchel 3A7 TaxID=2008913 RepID=UPI000BA3348A|nr:AAA family ATPase [Pseudomonas sp. Irchel 3A7]
MKYIRRIKLKNFGRFQSMSIDLDEKLNIFIGENEAGKSTILSAINLVLSGSRNRIEAIGVERILNAQAVRDFLSSTERTYEKLPTLHVELYFNEQNNFELNGKNNSDGVACDGLRMECVPSEELSNEIKEILFNDPENFPFEYYTVKFNTFQGEGYSGYKKYLRHILIDTSVINNEHATREYIGDMYAAYAVGSERHKHQNEYRKIKENFRSGVLLDLNGRVEDYSFSLKNDSKSNLFTDLTLMQGDTSIEHKGKGKQCFIKAEFALKKAGNVNNGIDIALIEEPENHLSHINMKKLIGRINESEDKQLFVATHSSLISARLDLRKCILLHGSSPHPVPMAKLPEDTAKYFMKAPDNGVLDFILSKKVILVEGDAEYILLGSFFHKVTGQSMEASDVHVISVDGTSFKRYLDISRLLGMKTAVIRDNDKNYQANCIDLYTDYVSDTAKVFFDNNNDRPTLEVCLYEDNAALCNDLFSLGRRTLTVQDYMLKNKTEAAFSILESKEGDIVVPQYIRDAIEWISQ